MQRALLPLVLLLVAACGSESGGASADGKDSGLDGSIGPGDAAGSDADAGSDDAGTTGQTTGDSLFVQLQLVEQLLPSSPSTNVAVFVDDAVTNTPLDGATVTLTPSNGAAVTLSASAQPGSYSAGIPGDPSPSYVLSVSHSVGSRTGIPVIPPKQFTIAISPPKVNTAATATWTPSGESDVSVTVSIGQFSSGTSPLPDTGSLLIPASAFPSPPASSLTLEIDRERVVSEPNQVSLRSMVSAYQSPIAVQP